MSLREQLLTNHNLTLDKNIFFQKNLTRPGALEESYRALREKEGRLYSDEIVSVLPDISASHPLREEWDVRKISLTKLVEYLARRRSCKHLLEIGCGNGWLANNLSQKLNADVCALDINEIELLQAARLFHSDRLNFIYADVFSLNPDVLFDTIVVPSSIQYFPELRKLIHRLLLFLQKDGEIHILDSPLYNSAKEIEAAKARSVEHFVSCGFPQMADRYFHHSFSELSIFKYRVIEDPRSIISIARRRLLKQKHPIFPWIVIEAN